MSKAKYIKESLILARKAILNSEYSPGICVALFRLEHDSEITHTMHKMTLSFLSSIFKKLKTYESYLYDHNTLTFYEVNEDKKGIFHFKSDEERIRFLTTLINSISNGKYIYR